MKPKHSILILVLFISVGFYSQNAFGEFSKTEFNLLSHTSDGPMNMFTCQFETKKQLVEFIDLKKGDVVAEIGAGNGINIAILSMFFDSVTFVAQDINAKTLNTNSYNKIIKKYQAYSNKPQTNTFELVIGTMTSSNLPDGKFDKLFIVNSFHDFDKQDEMLDDIYKKLKPNGQFILLEGFSFPGDTQICPDYGPHVLHTLDFEIPRFEKHGFYVTKMRAPYFKALHYGNALVFVKDKKLSESFYKEKNTIDDLVKHSFRFKQNDVASDSVIVKQITDSLKQKINDIVSVYNEFELFIREMGARHLKKMEYTAALNVFKANTTLFPDSYQVWYWLGVAYEKNKVKSMALESYKIALKLNPGNKICLDKVKSMSR